uniref:Uncharacterized protein n=1 Tax=Sus scrofa TaxID=9823 RepID=A0A8D1F5S5_PIG
LPAPEAACKLPSGSTMKLKTRAGFLNLCLSVPRDEEKNNKCTHEALGSELGVLCSSLNVFYRHLGKMGAVVSPSCINNYRSPVTHWSEPVIIFPGATDGATGIFVLVIPQIPATSQPEAQHWRRWLCCAISGHRTRKGQVQGGALLRTWSMDGFYSHFHLS